MTVLDNGRSVFTIRCDILRATGILRLPSYLEKEGTMNDKAMYLLKIFDLDG